MIEKKIYSLKDMNGEIVGVIKLKNVCTLADVREEVERCDVLEYPFEFISEGGYLIKSKQEDTWDVEETTIGVKRKSIELGSEHVIREMRQKSVPTDNDKNGVPHAASEEIISSHGSNIHENNNVHLDSIKVQSLIDSKVMDLWNSKLLELQKLLPTESINLHFFLEGDKPMIKIHCGVCNVDYGLGKILNAVDTIRNFRRSHITSSHHLKRNSHSSGENIEGEKDVQDVQERHKPLDYHEILHAINIFNDFMQKNIDSPFKVVESTIGDYKDKTSVQVECTKCIGKWFQLVPKTGNIIASLSEHMKSKLHNQNSTSQATIINNRLVGRPKKKVNDGKQQSLSKFLVHSSRNLEKGSTSTITSTPDQMRRG